MEFSLDYRSYRFRLNQPIALGMLVTGYREGIIVRLVDESGKVGYGEIAPVESFGSESMESAKAKLDGFYGRVNLDAIASLHDEGFGCTQFALRSAVKSILQNDSLSANIYSAALLPMESSQWDDTISSFQNQGYRSVKYKLRLDDQQVDSNTHLKSLLDAVQTSRLKLRLDANETLDLEQTQRILDLLEAYSASIDFLEQPLDRMLVAEMIDLSHAFNIPIALDESISAMGAEISSYPVPESVIWVIKPSLGDLNLVNESTVNPLVYSSVFETGIGYSAVIDLQDSAYDGGFGTQKVFEDSLIAYPSTPMPMQSGLWSLEKSQNLWERLQ